MNYFLFGILFVFSNLWIQILIILNKICIMYILNVLLFILNVWAISIYNLYSNIIRCKTFFHIILALFNNFLCLLLVFQCPLSLRFSLSIKTLVFIILAISMGTVTYNVSIIIILYYVVDRNHWGKYALFWRIWNLTFVFLIYFYYLITFLYLLIYIFCLYNFYIPISSS